MANFSLPYDIGVGGGPDYSRWFKLNLSVSANGAMFIQNTLENDTIRGWAGAYRLELHDLRDNSLLFRVDSPTYEIGAKPGGKAVRQPAEDITVAMSPAIAQIFLSNPSVYGVYLPDRLSEGDWLFDGSGALAKKVGEAIAS